MEILNSQTDFLQSLNRRKIPEIIALSASNKPDLKRLLLEIKNQVSSDPSWKNVALSAEKTRRTFSEKDPFRLLCLLETSDDPAIPINLAIECIDTRQERTWTEKTVFYSESDNCGKLAFIFPGQGSQYVGMGKEIVDCFPEAGSCLRCADDIVDLPEPLSRFIYPPEPPKNDEEIKANEEKLRATDIAQPSIGAISLAMIKILNGFGIKPDASCGHSYGELPALFCSGCFSEDVLLNLSAARGKYMALAGKGKDCGAMLAVKAPLDRIDEILKSIGTEVILANRNSRDQGVLSGATEEILKIKNVLKEQKIRSTLLPVAAAFHSRLVKDAAEPFQQTVDQVDFKSCRIPVYSNTTGTPYPDSIQDAKRLLGIHLINPVNFIDGIENSYKEGVRVFLEVGPKSVLTGLVKSILEGQDFFAIAIDASSGRKSSISDLAKALCQLAALGYPVRLPRWKALF